MTHPQTEDIPLKEIVNLISSEGTAGLAESIRVLINHAMKAERSKVLEAEPYQRTASRNESPGDRTNIPKRVDDGRFIREIHAHVVARPDTRLQRENAAAVERIRATGRSEKVMVALS